MTPGEYYRILHWSWAVVFKLFGLSMLGYLAWVIIAQMRRPFK